MRYGSSEQNFSLGVLALTALLIGEICFYRIETMYLYLCLTGFGMLIGIVVFGLPSFHFKLKVNSFPLWLALVFLMYMFYGLFRLNNSSFPWNTMFYRYFECIGLYFLVNKIISTKVNTIIKPFLYAGFFSMIYFFLMQREEIILGTQRIGDALSGNVNTVGYNFGIISIFAVWWYCLEKKWYKFAFFGLTAAIMLITGSKKVLIILVIDLLLIFAYDRKKASRWLKIGLAFAILGYLIFNVSYLYNIIGIRIESMIQTMLYGSSATIFSNSTDVRNEMIKEGFTIFLKRPLFGGGWNFFRANTRFSQYNYSHNNYIELLCTFGLVGTILYYSKHVSNLIYSIKILRSKINQQTQDMIFALWLTILCLLLDWTAVTFSAQCMWYIPLIISSVLVTKMKEEIF